MVLKSKFTGAAIMLRVFAAGGAVKLMGGGGGGVTKNKSLKRYLTIKKALHNMRNLRFYIPEILKFWMGYHVCGPS